MRIMRITNRINSGLFTGTSLTQNKFAVQRNSDRISFNGFNENEINLDNIGPEEARKIGLAIQNGELPFIAAGMEGAVYGGSTFVVKEMHSTSPDVKASILSNLEKESILGQEIANKGGFDDSQTKLIRQRSVFTDPISGKIAVIYDRVINGHHIDKNEINTPENIRLRARIANDLKRSGIYHCDAHAGNYFIKKKKDNDNK